MHLTDIAIKQSYLSAAVLELELALMATAPVAPAAEAK